MKQLSTPRAKLVAAAALLGIAVLLGSARDLGVTNLARVVLAVGVLVGLVLWSRRRRSGRGRIDVPPPPLRVTARAGLSPRCGLALVEVQGAHYLVAFGDGFAEIRPAPPPTRAESLGMLQPIRVRGQEVVQ